MDRGGLPQLYIHKLGHDIEEIRLRTLNHIIFKLEHELISYKELALNSEFVKQLLRWFDFKPIKEQESVINLLLELITSNEEARCYWQYIGVSDHLLSIRKKISAIHWTKLDKILELMLNSESGDDKVKHRVDFIPASSNERSVETESSPFVAFFEGEAITDELQQLSCQISHSRRDCNKISSLSQSMMPWFPKQPLSPGDCHVLSSVEHSLSSGLNKHIQGVQGCSTDELDKNDFDREDTLIRCCQFVFDVILRDFLPEVFLQQPGIATSLLDLLSFLGSELEPGFTDSSNNGKTTDSLHWVIKCLHRLTTSLHSQLLFYADPSIPNHKDNSIISSNQNTPTPSSCSLIVSPVAVDFKHRHHMEDIMGYTEHLSIPSEENFATMNATAALESSFQFSLPRFCISILFQTFSLLASHISGSHSKTFQSLMSLALVSVHLLSRIVDPIMWTSVNPTSAVITGGICEIFRLIGEVLLEYQGALSQKKGNSISGSSKSQCGKDEPSILSNKSSKSSVEPDFESCRLAYLQLLFLTRSFLDVAPKEPRLCRSAISKELSLALIIAAFDPPLQLLCPKVHTDLLKFVHFVSPEAARVCEQALTIAESVKIGIKVLRGVKKSYDDINKALLGLAFHESQDIVKKCWKYCTNVDSQEVNNSEKHFLEDQVASKSFVHTNENTPKVTSSRSIKTSTSVSSRRFESSHAGSSKSVYDEVDQAKSVGTEIHSKSSGQSGDLTKRSIYSDSSYHLEVKEAVFYESQNRVLTILKLLAHESCFVRKEIYSICRDMVGKLLGTASAKDFQSRGSGRRNLKSEGWRLDHLTFLWNRSVLTEIITHGATSTDEKIQNCAKEIILLILKCRTSVGEKIWNHAIEALLPCFPLLQCFADSFTPLGKAITKMFDPDVSASIGVDGLDVLRGNCRLLLNSENAVRGEAAIRLAWMLSLENQKDSSRDDEVMINSWKNINNRLPDRDALASSGPNTLANAFVFGPQDQSLNLRCHSKPSFSPNQSESIVQLLSLIGKKSDGNISLSDARVRRSALNQLALMLEHNTHLHSIFLQKDGLDIIMKNFQGALVEDDCEHYPDCAVPVTTILKHLAHWNPKVRKELSQQEVLYHCILRATALFYGEEGFRHDAAHLLCLLLYNDYIILLLPCPPSVSPSSLPINIPDPMASLKSLSLPYLLTQRIHFPFPCAVHWRTSHHSSSSPLSPNLMCERDTPLPEGCVNWSIVGGMEKYKESLPWQGLIRLQGCWEWYGQEGLLSFGGKKKLLPVVPKDEAGGGLPFAFPPRLRLSSSEEAFDGCPSRRAVCREVLSLIRELAGKGRMGDVTQEVGWAHAIYFIAQSLQFGDAERFYDLAFLEWALSCLVQLTGTPGWGHGVNKITAAVNKKKPPHSQDVLWEGLISGLIELLTAFHHGGQSLPNWASEEGRPEVSEKRDGNISSIRKTRVSSNQDELLSAASLEVTGSFMGLSITRSALLCLNHVLSEMQESCTKSSQINWEMIWSKVLMNAGRTEQRGHLRTLWHGSMQGWLLPLWSSRDPMIRAASLQLAGGLAAISSPAHVPAITKNAKKSRSPRESIEPPLGLRLLEEGLAGFPGGVWGTALSFFLDQCESSLVREQAALLLTNLIAASEKIPGNVMDILIQDGLIFKEVGLLASQLFIGHLLPQSVLLAPVPVVDGVVTGDMKDMAWSTPGLVQAACQLLQNIMMLKPKVVSSAMWEGNGFLFRRLFGCLGRIPKEEKKDHVETMLYIDVLGLYSEVLSLLTSVMVWDTRLVALLPQPNPLTSVFSLMESKYYKTGNELEGLKHKLWRKAFGFTSATLGSIIDQQGKSFLGNDAAVAPEKYYSVYLEAAYDSIIGNDVDLRRAALYSLNALFSLELQHSICQAEVLESNQDEGNNSSPLLKLLQGLCSEHREKKERVATFTQRSLEEGNEKGNTSVKSESAFKLCHLLIQLYEPERVPLTEVSVTLSSLLALSVNAKYCALASGLVETLVIKGRNLHVSIVMGESEESLLIQPKLFKGVVNKKQQPKLWMKDMRLLFRLLTNFLHSGDMGSIRKEMIGNSYANPIKLEAVRIGLSDVLHKLCPFAMLATSLLSDFLRLLSTFTTDCPAACQSLVYTSRTIGVGPRQNLASSSLLHLLCELAPKETDSLLFLHMTYQSKKTQDVNLKQAVDILSLTLATLRNACDVQECRMIMAKGGLFRSLIKLHPIEKRNNQQLGHAVEDLWLFFLLHFTTYSEGQLSIPKIPDMFDLLLCLSKKPTSKHDTFLSVLRNLAFHPQNRARLLASDNFLQLLVQVLNKTDGSIWHKEIVGSAVWALSANNYKGKQILKGAGLDNALRAGLSFLWSVSGGVGVACGGLKEDKNEENKEENDVERVANVLKCALNILGCEREKRSS